MTVRLAVPTDGPLDDATAAGLAAALAADPDLTLDVVGPAGAAGFDHERLTSTPAVALAPSSPDPAALTRAVRAQRAAAVRVAAQSVAAGKAEGLVGLTGWAATGAAVRFAQRLLPGATAPIRGSLLALGDSRILLGSGPDLLTTAVALAAATAAAGVPTGVAFLADPAGELAAEAALVGVPVATAGVAGSLALGPVEAVAWLAGLDAGLAVAARPPAEQASFLLGAPGVVVTPGHAGAGDAVVLAAGAVRAGLGDAQTRAFAALVAHRRGSAGLP